MSINPYQTNSVPTMPESTPEPSNQHLSSWRDIRSRTDAFLQKWVSALLQPINQPMAKVAIAKLYQKAGYAMPEVTFLRSPITRKFGHPASACVDINRGNTTIATQISSLIDHSEIHLLTQLSKQLDEGALMGLAHSFSANVYRYLDRAFYDDSSGPFETDWCSQLDKSILIIQNTLQEVNSFNRSGVVKSYEKMAVAAICECAVSMGCELDTQPFELLVNSAFYLFAIYPFEKVCFVLERPQIKFNAQGDFHAVAQPAIAFADGVGVAYFYNGVKLPEHFGSVHPKQWKSQWILQEKNVEVRRILIKEIGYARLYQELHAEELDVWREYTLLRLPIYDDFSQTNWQQRTPEAIYLLKMTCPSTRSIYILRVPPTMRMAREAATWINWGIDPGTLTFET